jgi:fructoselysine-6-P-deglycase FrlB-like protein
MTDLALCSPRMRRIAQEIESQPSVWRLAAAQARDEEEILPRHGARVAVVGCGTSFYVGQAFALAREADGLGESDAFVASEMPTRRTYDEVVAISRSGTTSEVLWALESLRCERTTAITSTDDTPIRRIATGTVVLGFADEASVVQTRFATGALMLLLAHLGHDVESYASAGEKALVMTSPLDLRSFEQFVFIGRGWSLGLANEAALKFRESAGVWSEAYPAMEYRHGPISVANRRTVVWCIGGGEALRADVEATGATFVNAGLGPLGDLVLAQRSAVTLAGIRGVDPGNPRHLSRSVVLDGSHPPQRAGGGRG